MFRNFRVIKKAVSVQAFRRMSGHEPSKPVHTTGIRGFIERNLSEKHQV
jgi:hypothetical protein